MMEDVSRVMSIIRSAVRPFITATGWSMLLFLVYRIVDWLIGRLSGITIDQDLVVPILVGIVTSFISAMSVIVAFWLGERKANRG